MRAFVFSTIVCLGLITSSLTWVQAASYSPDECAFALDANGKWIDGEGKRLPDPLRESFQKLRAAVATYNASPSCPNGDCVRLVSGPFGSEIYVTLPTRDGHKDQFHLRNTATVSGQTGETRVIWSSEVVYKHRGLPSALLGERTAQWRTQLIFTLAGTELLGIHAVEQKRNILGIWITQRSAGF